MTDKVTALERCAQVLHETVEFWTGTKHGRRTEPVGLRHEGQAALEDLKNSSDDADRDRGRMSEWLWSAMTALHELSDDKGIPLFTAQEKNSAEIMQKLESWALSQQFRPEYLRKAREARPSHTGADQSS